MNLGRVLQLVGQLPRPGIDDLSSRAKVRSVELTADIESLATLEHVVRWGLAQTPQLDIIEVVIQDEFSHDVVMTTADHHFLVFDTG